VSLVPSATAADTKYLPDIQRIVDKGELAVAVIAQDIPPMIVTGEKGRLQGFDPELARAIAKALGVEVKFIRRARTFDEVVEQVASGVADVGISYLTQTPRRAMRIYFTRHYLTQNWSLLVNRVQSIRNGWDCPDFPELEVAAKQEGKIGVLRGSSSAQLLETAIPEALPERFKSFVEMETAVRNGKVVASLQGEILARGILRRYPRLRIYMKLCEMRDTDDLIAIAVRPDAPNLRYWLNVFLESRGIEFNADTIFQHEGIWKLTR
ncbi:MAG: substrate-binding periplasmic protein, partial [Gemmatimonadales bacterium]